MRIAKQLTANDLGLTGGHQAGIHVPKDSPLVSLIEEDSRGEENPRVTLNLFDEQTGFTCSSTLIYYNNSRRGGTRDEYRITGTTTFLKLIGAEMGDELVLKVDDAETLLVSLVKRSILESKDNDDEPIKLNGKWRFIGGTI
jgi:hypothetical protein